MGEQLWPRPDLPGDEWRLPYPTCRFEFLVNGFPVLFACREDLVTFTAFDEDDGGTSIRYAIKANGFWVYVDSSDHGDENLNLWWFLYVQVRGICVALEAQMAEERTQAPPAALNRKRLRNGLAPIGAHTVVDLVRPRTGGGSGPHSGEKVRLHFRRGHWRRLEEKRVWVKWALVGNPALGWIDHHYKL
jgi:hypothetical protein